MRYSFLLLLILLFACKNDKSGLSSVDNDRIFQKYIIEYNESNAHLFASAAFYLDGNNSKALLLDSTGSVSFDDKPMKPSTYKDESFYKYSENNKNAAGKMYIFRLSIPDEVPVENRAALLPARLSIPGEINVEQDLTLAINTSDWREGEMLRLEISDSISSVKLDYHKNDIRNHTILISKKVFESFSSSTAEIKVTRRGELPLSNGFKAGGSLFVAYVAAPVPVKFLKRNAGS